MEHLLEGIPDIGGHPFHIRENETMLLPSLPKAHLVSARDKPIYTLCCMHQTNLRPVLQLANPSSALIGWVHQIHTIRAEPGVGLVVVIMCTADEANDSRVVRPVKTVPTCCLLDDAFIIVHPSIHPSSIPPHVGGRLFLSVDEEPDLLHGNLHSTTCDADQRH
jgi:hypothetical protein